MADIGRGPFTLDELIAERQKGYTQGYDDARRETARKLRDAAWRVVDAVANGEDPEDDVAYLKLVLEDGDA